MSGRSDRLNMAELEERLIEQGQRLRVLEEKSANDAKEIVRLKDAAKTVAVPQAQDDRGLPEGAVVDAFGHVIRGGKRIGRCLGEEGKFEAFQPPRSNEEVAAEQAAEQKRIADEHWGRAIAGLPQGMYRDPWGVVRDSRTGRVANTVLEEREGWKKHEEWLKKDGPRARGEIA